MTTQEPVSGELQTLNISNDEKPDEMFEYVISFKAKDEVVQETKSCCGTKKKDTSSKVKARAIILKRLNQVGLIISKAFSGDRSEIYYRIGADSNRIEEQAEHMKFQLKLKEEHGGGYSEFTKKRKKYFEGSGDPQNFFTSLQRQAIVKDIIENRRRDGGAEINLAREVAIGNLLSFYPLHEDKTVSVLLQSWASPKAAFRNWFINQPLDDIRNYMGESVAIYFAWLGHYTKWLMFSSLIGVPVFIIIIFFEDSGIEAFYAIFLAFWATLFLESWKRRNAEIAFNWNMRNFEETEKTRPEFHGDDKTGIWANGVFVDLKPEEGGVVQQVPTSVFFKPVQRLFRMAAGLPAIFSIIIIVIAATVGVITARIFFQNINSSYGVFASLINAVAIIILNMVYQRVALALNNWENYRTNTEYNDALITKTFAFQFVNSYISLFYIAYFKANTIAVLGIPNLDDGCKYGMNNCILELMIQLGTILATNIFVGQSQEVGIPFIMNKIKARSDMKRAIKAQGDKPKDEQKKFTLSKVERESNYAKFSGTFGEYNEMVIQYGYVTMFAAAFPLAPLLALLNNIVEIRSDAFKMLTSIQRPNYQGAQDIGTWYKILNIIGYVAVLTNCLIISVTSKQLRAIITANYSFVMSYPSVNLTAIIITLALEHIIILAKFIVSEIIPDEPGWVRVELGRQDFKKDQAFKHEDDEESKIPEFDDNITAEEEANFSN